MNENSVDYADLTYFFSWLIVIVIGFICLRHYVNLVRLSYRSFQYETVKRATFIRMTLWYTIQLICVTIILIFIPDLIG
jgi:hypothetical protein